eukprot:scpid83899/ scgid27308/ 
MPQSCSLSPRPSLPCSVFLPVISPSTAMPLRVLNSKSCCHLPPPATPRIAPLHLFLPVLRAPHHFFSLRRSLNFYVAPSRPVDYEVIPQLARHNSCTLDFQSTSVVACHM